ncbi:MAG: hypothetical protein GDA49_00210 [Rhodospirillales bacterium]|nr:hypothetical protein [Rhodospirillales bacterium]
MPRPIRVLVVALAMSVAAPAWSQTIEEAVGLQDGGDHEAAFEAFSARAADDNPFDVPVDPWDTGEVPKGVLNEDIIARLETVLAERATAVSLVETDASVDESGLAAYLRGQIDSFMSSMNGLLGEEGGDLHYVTGIEEDDAGNITARVRDIEVSGPDSSWEIGDAVMTLRPVGDDRYMVAVALPRTTSFLDGRGRQVGGTEIGSQRLEGTMVPSIDMWSQAVGLYTDLRIWSDVPGEGQVDVVMDSAALDIDLSEDANQKWSGPGSITVEGITARLEGMELMRLGQLDTGFSYAGWDLIFFAAIDEQIDELQAGIADGLIPDGDIEMHATGILDLVMGMAEDRAPVAEAFSMAATVTDLFFQDPDSGETVAIASLNFGMGMDGLDGNASSLFIEYGHDGLDVPVPGPKADLVPHMFDMRISLNDLPLQDATAMMLEMLGGAMEDPEAFEEQARMALGFMALGLQQRMVQSGSNVRIERLSYESPALSADLVADIVASDQSPNMAVGTARLEVVGLDDLMKRMEEQAARGHAEARDAAQEAARSLAMMQAMGERLDDGGTVRHIYDVELAPDGTVLLNGNDMGPLIGGMMQ